MFSWSFLPDTQTTIVLLLNVGARCQVKILVGEEIKLKDSAYLPAIKPVFLSVKLFQGGFFPENLAMNQPYGPLSNRQKTARRGKIKKTPPKNSIKAR